MIDTSPRLSLTDFLLLPEVKPALELLGGLVCQKPLPSGPHSALQGWFGICVAQFAEPPELGRAFPEVRLLLGEDTYVPDLVVYRWDRIPEDEHGNLPTYFQAPPDLAVEIVSPGQTLTRQLERCRELIEHGVRVAVLVHPGQQTVHVLRASGETGPLRAGDALDLTDILPGFQLSLTDLFARLRARPPRA